MLSTRSTLRAATGIAALTLALPAAAQDADLPALPELPSVEGVASEAPVATQVWIEKEVMTTAEIDQLPAEYRNLPVGEEISTTTVNEDGVETITRTRRIVSRSPVETSYRATGAQGTTYVLRNPRPAYTAATYPAPSLPAATFSPMVLDRESWIAECERRTRGRDRDSTGTIIGGLLGAIGGGILGNRVWDSERLAGTLIGGGLGGIAGGLIGSLFNGKKKDDLYDCESALSTYLDNYGQYGGARFASRVIAAPAPVTYQGYPAYGYSYAQPAYYPPTQTMVMVPVTTYQQQRVIVRETAREETYEVPGAVRSIPEPRPSADPRPLPSPKMIKRAPAPAPAPKMIKQ